jgi:hypothetical protein
MGIFVRNKSSKKLPDAEPVAAAVPAEELAEVFILLISQDTK